MFRSPSLAPSPFWDAVEAGSNPSLSAAVRPRAIIIAARTFGPLLRANIALIPIYYVRRAAPRALPLRERQRLAQKRAVLLLLFCLPFPFCFIGRSQRFFYRGPFSGLLELSFTFLSVRIPLANPRIWAVDRGAPEADP